MTRVTMFAFNNVHNSIFIGNVKIEIVMCDNGHVVFITLSDLNEVINPSVQ